MSLPVAVVVKPAVGRRVRNLMDPKSIRDEARVDVVRGGQRIVAYTVQESLAHYCHVSTREGDIHPASFRTAGSLPVAFRSRWRGSRLEVTGVVREDECSTNLSELGPLPWKGRPHFEPRRHLSPHFTGHLLDHPKSFGGPVTEEMIRKGLSHMGELVASRRVEVSRYWYADTRSWCFVAPLSIPGRDTVASVLVPRADRYDVVTVLPLHEAFWNVATVGLAPPTWLNGTPCPSLMVKWQ